MYTYNFIQQLVYTVRHSQYRSRLGRKLTVDDTAAGVTVEVSDDS